MVIPPWRRWLRPTPPWWCWLALAGVGVALLVALALSCADYCDPPTASRKRRRER